MSFCGPHISKLGAWARLCNRVARLRYLRGHGVHSPYIYSVVRKVFMRREIIDGDRTLYSALCRAGIPRRQAVQLQNLALHCRLSSFAVDGADCNMVILTPALPQERTLQLVADAAAEGAAVVLLSPYRNDARQALCGRIVAAHASTSVDKWHYLLLFNNHLPKQHFQI